MNKIIDIHGHLGDILRGEDIIYQKNKMVHQVRMKTFIIKD